MPAERPRLRKREIIGALSAGALAAGTAALILSDEVGSSREPVAEASDAKTYQVEDFQQISTEGSQDVEITFGETPGVRAEGAPDALDQLEVVVEDGELVIRPSNRFRGDWESLRSATFFVTVPRLERVSMAGSGDISVDRIESDTFSGEIAGSGTLAITQMTVDSADFSIGGSGNVSAAGTARDTRVSIGGAGEVEAAGLRSDTARVSIGGVGDVELTVNDKADISIAGQGDVEISGTARCSVSRFGIGEVSCNGVEID
jgi:hypothetical protein